jgi:hypothetical protein
VTPSPGFAVGSIVYGVGAAALGGRVAVALSRRREAGPAVFVAAIIATIAALSLATQYGRGSVWSELATMFLMAPAAALGPGLRGAGAGRQ